MFWIGSVSVGFTFLVSVMCGRYALFISESEMKKIFQAEIHVAIPPRYNIAPTTNAPIVRQIDGQRRIDNARWSYTPSWSKSLNTSYNTINAKAERVLESKLYKPAMKHRRALVISSGWYEWRTRLGQSKQPYFISLKNGQPMAFAGLWDEWKSPDGEIITNFAIIVTAANPLVNTIHDRMTCILAPDRWDYWLDTGNHDVDALHGELISYPTEELQMWPVNTYVNKVGHEGGECIRKVEAT